MYILDKHPSIDITELKDWIWYYTDPAGINLMPLVDRNDLAVDQIIRNIISHRNDSSNNIIYRGLVSYNAGILDITPSGQIALDDFIKQKAL